MSDRWPSTRGGSVWTECVVLTWGTELCLVCIIYYLVHVIACNCSGSILNFFFFFFFFEMKNCWRVENNICVLFSRLGFLCVICGSKQHHRFLILDMCVEDKLAPWLFSRKRRVRSATADGGETLFVRGFVRVDRMSSAKMISPQVTKCPVWKSLVQQYSENVLMLQSNTGRVCRQQLPRYRGRDCVNFSVRNISGWFC